MLRHRIRRCLILMALTLTAYVGSYTVLTWQGRWTWSQTGRLRYNFGLSVTDVKRWQPAWAYWEPYRDANGSDTSRGNPQGYFYSPLMRLDRLWFHPDELV